MEQRLSLITLGVADVGEAVGFYERLGWSPANDWRAQGVAFFQAGGMVIALWSRDELAADSTVSDADADADAGAEAGAEAGAWGGVTLAHNVRSPAEVDAVLAEAERAGATIGRAGAATEWGGYSGLFLDPDGHPWEVAHNPHWTIAADGSIDIG